MSKTHRVRVTIELDDAHLAIWKKTSNPNFWFMIGNHYVTATRIDTESEKAVEQSTRASTETLEYVPEKQAKRKDTEK